MIELGLLALLLSGDMNKANVVNLYLHKSAAKTGTFLGSAVNKLDEEKEEIYARPLKSHKEPKSKAEKIYDVGGKFGIDAAYQRGKIELEDFPENYFK